MALTDEEKQALERKIASGTKSVTWNGRRKENQDASELIAVEKHLEEKAERPKARRMARVINMRSTRGIF